VRDWCDTNSSTILTAVKWDRQDHISSSHVLVWQVQTDRHIAVYKCCHLLSSHWICAQLESVVNVISARGDTCLRDEGKQYRHFL
jgi:hypothetical protein